MRKVYLVVFLSVLISAAIQPVYASPAAEMLCDAGLKLYRQSRYEEALREFKNALLADSSYEPARIYIRMVQRTTGVAAPVPPRPFEREQAPSSRVSAGTPAPLPRVPARQFSRAAVVPPSAAAIPAVSEPAGAPVTLPPLAGRMPALPITTPPGIREEIRLDQALRSSGQPVEITQNSAVFLVGRDIRRFLVTQPGVIEAEKVSGSELRVEGTGLGSTYLLVWDGSERWTIGFRTVPVRPEGPTVEEELRRAEEQARNFLVTYHVDWSSLETGRRLDDLDRTFYSWTHSLDLRGETPYGKLDSAVTGSRLNKTSDVTYYTLGLTEGHLGELKGFSARVFDLTPPVANLAYQGTNVRGAMLHSPAFDNAVDYTIFTGKEGGGRYASISPGFAGDAESSLSGFDLNLHPLENQDYGFSVFHGWGDRRLEELNPYGYDFEADWRFDGLRLGYEAGYDSERFAHLGNIDYQGDGFAVSTEARDISKDFHTMTGLVSRAGEQGFLTNANYSPNEDVTFTGRLDTFRDRLFPNEAHPQRWNQDLAVDANVRLGDDASLRGDYALQNDRGRVSPFRSHTAGIGLNKAFDWFRRINTYATYRYYTNRNYDSSSLDYFSNKLLLGCSFNLLKDLNFFINEELSWIDALNADEQANPRAMQTGLEWGRRILESPFYATMRMLYRDEENTSSPFSFLAGEDYLEGFGEIAYRPDPGFEIFFNARARNVWADNPSVNKHIDLNFYAGMRYMWDTGFRWDPEGTVAGFVYKDVNSDGIWQRGEPGIQGVKVWMGNEKSQVTNDSGFYSFGRVKARSVLVSLDTMSIPSGFQLTGPLSRELTIENARLNIASFGFTSRTEITGTVFEDVDAAGKLSLKSLFVKGVRLTLEDGSEARTDSSGRYAFRGVKPGKHKVSLDLKSVPPEYIPTVPIFKEVELAEGMSFTYLIPLKKSSQQP